MQFSTFKIKIKMVQLAGTFWGLLLQNISWKLPQVRIWSSSPWTSATWTYSWRFSRWSYAATTSEVSMRCLRTLRSTCADFLGAWAPRPSWTAMDGHGRPWTVGVAGQHHHVICRFQFTITVYLSWYVMKLLVHTRSCTYLHDSTCIASA